MFPDTRKLNFFSFDFYHFALSIMHMKPALGTFWSSFLERGRSQACWQERCTEIYYKQIRLWSELKEDVKMQSRLNVAWAVCFRQAFGPSGHWVYAVITLPAVSVHAPALKLDGQSMAPAALWLRVRLPLWLLKLKLYVCTVHWETIIKCILQIAYGAFVACEASRCLKVISTLIVCLRESGGKSKTCRWACGPIRCLPLAWIMTWSFLSQGHGVKGTLSAHKTKYRTSIFA